MDVIIDESGLGQRLQEARRTAGLTQQSLCQLANISYSTLAKIERGAIKAPSIFTIQSLTDALGISLDALMGKSAQDAVTSSDKKSVSKNGIKFVYYDVNGCLVQFMQRALTCLARETGISADTIEDTFWHYNDAVCRGQMTVAEFNIKLAECLHVTVIDWQGYYMAAVQSVPGMKEIIGWTAEHYQIGLLTNIMPGFLDDLIARGLVPDVAYDKIVDSSIVHAIKPEARIFDIATSESGVKPNEILFIDDDQSNIAAAEKLGWHVLLCNDFQPEETISRIRQALILA